MFLNWRGWKVRFEVPETLVAQHPPQTLIGILRGFEISYLDEIEHWMRDQGIRYFGIRGSFIMGGVVLGPFSTVMRKHDAVHFKMRWM